MLSAYGFSRQHVFKKLQTSALNMSMIFSIAWGALMEITQLTIFTYRSAEWADFFANTFAALFAILVIRIFKLVKR
jgi:VanZ family protein